MVSSFFEYTPNYLSSGSVKMIWASTNSDEKIVTIDDLKHAASKKLPKSYRGKYTGQKHNNTYLILSQITLIREQEKW